MTKRTAHKRIRARGAAMVEAAVVIPVMVIFLGLTVFTYRGYDEKLAQQTTTRSEVLYYASHNCEGAAPASVSKQGDSADVTDGDTSADGPGSKLRESERAGLDRNYNMASAQRSSVVRGTAVEDRRTIGLSRPISSMSKVACNEKRFDNRWTGIFGFIGGFARSGGGFL